MRLHCFAPLKCVTAHSTQLPQQKPVTFPEAWYSCYIDCMVRRIPYMHASRLTRCCMPCGTAVSVLASHSWGSQQTLSASSLHTRLPLAVTTVTPISAHQLTPYCLVLHQSRVTHCCPELANQAFCAHSKRLRLQGRYGRSSCPYLNTTEP